MRVQPPTVWLTAVSAAGACRVWGWPHSARPRRSERSWNHRCRTSSPPPRSRPHGAVPSGSGIEPVPGPLGTVMRGPMFVEWEAPAEPQPGPPWVLVHGGGGQGIDYTTTFDGRRGWSRLLVEQGHTVFVVDRPGHGRSPHHPDILGAMGPQLGFEFLRPIFVPPPEGPDSNPAAHLHTQWPGGREPGDPVYDQCLCTSGPMLADPAEMHALEAARLGRAARSRRPGDRRHPLGRRSGDVCRRGRAAGQGGGAVRDRDPRPPVPESAGDGGESGVGAGLLADHLRPAGHRPVRARHRHRGARGARPDPDHAPARARTAAGQPQSVPDRRRDRGVIDVPRVRPAPRRVPGAGVGATSSSCGWPTTASTGTAT